MTARINRRVVLASALMAAAVSRPSLARETSFAVIDWGLLETALAIGAVPAAATELLQYRRIVVEPMVPPATVDLGLRGTPNQELLRLVAPSLIVISNFYEYQRDVLERTAPVLSLPIYEPGRPPYPLAATAMERLGHRLGREREATAYVEASAALISRYRDRLSPLAARRVFIISMGDARHFRAFGGDSMVGDVLERLGLANAWTDPTNYSAAAPVGLEALARDPDAAIVIVAPVPPEVERSLADNALWNALPAVRHGRVATIDPVNHFGGLPSARRFARLMVEAAPRWGGRG